MTLMEHEDAVTDGPMPENKSGHSLYRNPLIYHTRHSLVSGHIVRTVMSNAVVHSLVSHPLVLPTLITQVLSNSSTYCKLPSVYRQTSSPLSKQDQNQNQNQNQNQTSNQNRKIATHTPHIADVNQ